MQVYWLLGGTSVQLGAGVDTEVTAGVTAGVPSAGGEKVAAGVASTVGEAVAAGVCSTEGDSTGLDSGLDTVGLSTDPNCA